MSRKVLLVLHQATSDPGRVGEAIRTRGFDLDIRIPAIGQPLPKTMDGHAAAVIFGGPMSANDDHEDFIRKETKLIDVLLKSETPYLGICLGAQIMARALGARVAEHKEGLREVGYYQLTPTEDGRSLFKKPMMAYQWHREGFDVPDGATLLACGDFFPNQAFQVGKNAYGIQFHPEVTEAMNRRWTTKAAHMLNDPGAQSREMQLDGRRKYDADMCNWLNSFLDHWLPPLAQRQAAFGS
ncbi:glutamine amidotransferase [Sneathiella litorea]|uniref:Glutamine amidotransferase n=1 Tax=Sneathiella litorea TaxID=2606216 RepID=A0A6L8W3T1_9PROT|nr:glutamine amidotransferase [Sneathiella litorea]MZR29134.1 glutamine amidotransferase [Sneathiella litorea]